MVERGDGMTHYAARLKVWSEESQKKIRFVGIAPIRQTLIGKIGYE